MKKIFISALLLFVSSVSSVIETCDIQQNNCITFSVSQGTGCSWMCNYCATQLGTNNYYFVDNVCTYKEGIGCVGNPYAGVSYTCCSL